jgi:AcrR family transcriptional regulator
MEVMGRPRIHSDEAILDAARSLVLEGGAKSTTVDAIVAVSGAPKGSLYNRFASVNDLLAAMWMRAVRRSQAAFLDAMREPDPVAAAVAGALSIHDFAQSEPLDSRLLAALRREDLIGATVSPRLKKELLDLNEPLQAALIDLARRLFGAVSDETVERTVCAVIDIPQGAVRRHLLAGSALPLGLREQLEAAVRAALTVDTRSDTPPSRARRAIGTERKRDVRKH